MPFINPAPGAPGIPARWTSSAKSGVGRAVSAQSSVWFTVSHGILNEVYYPRIDQACIRDFGLIVTNGRDFFSEEKRHAASVIRPIADGTPVFNIVSSCTMGRYRIEKTVLSDPRRDVVLQRVRFHALLGALPDYRIYALLAPHLVNRGARNTAWVGDYKGVPMLFATGGGSALALGCSAPFLGRSVGFVGVSDGWQDLTQHFALQWQYDIAQDGNVALTGEIDLSAGEFVLALGFGRHPEEAALRVRASLSDDLDEAIRDCVSGWQTWHEKLLPLDRKCNDGGRNPYRISAAVLRTHEAGAFAGGHIASLSVPWGFAKGDEDLGGYHLVWPRDLVEVAGGLLAAGAKAETCRVVRYLQAIQEADGHWPQNCWLDGKAYWSGVQLDETAFPILLVDLAFRGGALTPADLDGLWPTLRRAAGFIVRSGPITMQDRWEEDGGYSPFTLAVEIAGLLAAAEFCDRAGDRAGAQYLRETADFWNTSIERWTFATDTPLAHQLDIPGYYVRIAPPERADAASPFDGFVPIKNRPPDESRDRAVHIVSPDALALVRFGLRAPNDPRILATVRAIDALLRVEFASGPCWYRYNGDGYGEHADGGPFDGTGIGRAWPLLTGERAHYELAAGRVAEAERLLTALESFSSDGKLIPEQVWDATDIPERELFRGRPSGSAMPLAWAHAEHLKLLRSLADGRVFDMPPQPRERYQVAGITSPHALWRFNHKCQSFPQGRILRIETSAPAVVHWSIDGWQTVHDTPSRDSGFGMQVVDIPTAECRSGSVVVFTFFWPKARRWEGVDYNVRIM